MKNPTEHGGKLHWHVADTHRVVLSGDEVRIIAWDKGLMCTLDRIIAMLLGRALVEAGEWEGDTPCSTP